MTAVSTALLWFFSTWRPRFIFSGQAPRELGPNGARSYATSAVWFLNSNTDTILIARFLGPASLGAYALAFDLMLFPISRIATPIRSVLFRPVPHPGRQDAPDRRVVEGTRLVAAITMPAMLGMIVVAPDFVPVVLSERWTDAVPVLQILATVGCFSR